jgi:tetrahydromethanopterin S-methyltransferase subunit A
LKAKSVSDLPFVKGMLQKVDAATVDEGTATAIAKKIAQTSSIAAFANAAGAQSSKVQSAGIPKIMADVIATANDTYKE